MPEIVHYKVTQTREVEVAANSAADAARIAEAAFLHGQDGNHSVAHGRGPTGIFGNTVGRIRETDLRVTRRA